MEETWIHGNFPPKLWNMWKKSTDLTNNQNEGYNSRINKILAANHPNPWILVCMLTKELIRAETETLWIKVKDLTQLKLTYKPLMFYRLEILRELKFLRSMQL